MTNFVEKDVGSPEKAADKNTSVEDETWIERIERYSVDNVSKTLAMAVDREEVAEAVINCLGEEFERGALFLVRSDTACGWKAVCRGEEIEGFELLHIPLSQPSVLRTVAEGRNYYLGPLVDTTLNRRIAAGIGGGEPGPVLVMPLLIRDRVVNIFVMEGGKKDLGEYLPQMQRLLTKTVLAFEILIAREKILMT